MKKTISLILCITLTASLLATAAFAQGGLSYFQKTLTYKDGKFTDVAASDWFSMNVKAAYEYGLINGKTAKAFGASDNVTIAETITLAARLHSIYNNGKANFTEGTPWYQVYVDYAITNGIISNGRFEDYTAYATRLQFAEVFAAAFPSSALIAINNINAGDIPDVSLDSPYQSVYTLYNAGVLTGKTAAGNFCPSENILRSEMAAIVTRMANASLRVSFTIEKATPSGTITSGVQLLEATNSARQSVALALESYNTAYVFAGTNNTMALAYLGKAKEYTTMAAQYAQNAAVFCKANSKYSTAYNDINNSSLGCIQSLEYIAAVAAAPASAPAKWEYASKLLSGSGEALSRAAETINAIG